MNVVQVPFNLIIKVVFGIIVWCGAVGNAFKPTITFKVVWFSLL